MNHFPHSFKETTWNKWIKGNANKNPKREIIQNTRHKILPATSHPIPNNPTPHLQPPNSFPPQEWDLRHTSEQDGASLVAQMVKNPPAMPETWVQSLHCRFPGRHRNPPVFLPGESPWIEEPGRLQSLGLQLNTTEHKHSTARRHNPCLHD